jgi:ABC-type sugar transport system ATPase subunit
MNEIRLEKDLNINNKIAFRVKNISKIYPGTIALKNLSMDIKKGTVHGIIGKNGAGKSTLVGIIAGIITPTRGEIFIEDKRFNTLSRVEAKNKKISIITQEPEIIPDCTVAENLFLPSYICRRKIIDWKRIYFEAEEIMKKAGFVNLDVMKKAGDFSISERQILLLLKACYVDNANIIIMDEVSSSLTQNDEKQLYKIIKERKKEGKTIIFISHRIDEILEVCDEVSVIRDGELICTEDCSKLNKHELSNLIVGKGFHFENFEQEDENVRWGKRKTQKIVLSVKNLTNYLVYKNISFDLEEGEILGIAGLSGSGRTEILKGIAGIVPADGGYIKIGDQKKIFTKPSQAFENHIVYMPEDKDKEGLVSSLTIRENLTINVLRKIGNIIAINRKKEDKLVTHFVNLLEIKTTSIEQRVDQLSGGNKQKVVLGKILATKPTVYLLDEPTKGIDIEAKDNILKLIKDKLSKSSSVIMTSPGLEDLLLICDRILILYKGEITGEFSKDEFREKEIYLAIQGGK